MASENIGDAVAAALEEPPAETVGAEAAGEGNCGNTVDAVSPTTAPFEAPGAKKQIVLVPQYDVTTVWVDIPQVVLTADDCEPMFSRPPPLNCEIVGPLIEFPVPSSSGPGKKLNVALGDDGEGSVIVSVPELAEPGDMIMMSKREDGSWRVVRKTTEYSFLLPDCNPGDTVRLHVPDGRQLVFPVPEGAVKDLLVSLVYDESSGWNFNRLRQVSMPVLADLDWVAGPYTTMLGFLQSNGYLEYLAGRGEVRVSVPFCGHFFEFAALGKFLNESVLSLPGARSVFLHATELVWTHVHEWAAAELWFRREYPAIRMISQVQDLAEDPLPEADLTIGIHPEVTKGRRWFQVIASLLQSCSNGLVVLACFYETEAQTVQNMVEMYKAPEATVEVVENPYYATSDVVDDNPAIRYLVLVRSGSSVAQA